MRYHPALVMLSACVISSVSVAAAGAACNAARSAMERMICADPAIAARDAAMTMLYHAELPLGRAASLAAQRQWLASALSCRTRQCLIDRYDARNGTLLQSDDGHRVARRFHLEIEGRSGDLLILQRGAWLTYDATETVIGPGGQASGDVDAARMQGTVRLEGAVARDVRPDGCTAVLRRNGDGSWSMATRSCFTGDRADLHGRFQPVR